jgi:tetratricopeptide (TPR) repeat protein
MTSQSADFVRVSHGGDLSDDDGFGSSSRSDVLRESLDRIALNRSDLAAHLEAVGTLLQHGDHAGIARLAADAPDSVRLSAELGILLAIVSEWQGDLPLSLERWTDLSRRFPGLAKSYESRGRLLLMAGRQQEAASILDEMPHAAKIEPEGIVLAVRLAVARGAFGDARDSMRLLDARLAATPGAVAAPILEELRLAIDGGEADLRRAASVTAARDAGHMLDWPSARRIWTELLQDHPGDREMMPGLACTLRDAGDLDEADQHFDAARLAFPNDIQVLAERAQVPARRLDWQGSAERWRAVLASSPDAILFAGLAAIVFAEAGEPAEAAALLDRAEAADPARTDLVVPQAVVAEHAHDWHRAVACWKRAVRLHPEDRHFRDQLGRAVWHREFEPISKSFQDSDAGNPLHADHGRDAVERGFETLMQSFENLCDTCEFGLVQRHYGIEPVSLFRFAGVTPEKLVELLQLEFEPIGDPSHTRVEDKLDEYMIYDDRGYFFLHSMVKKSEVRALRYLEQQTARIGFLKRKIIADLQAARKTFICRRTGDAIADQTLRDLSAGLRRYGDNLLLGVRVADAQNPVGSVKFLSDDIMVGYVGFTFYNDGSEIDYEGWLSMLREADRLRSVRAATTGALRA